MVPCSCEFQVYCIFRMITVLMLFFMFRLRKVRVMLALLGFTRRSFNNFYHSSLMTPEYIWDIRMPRCIHPRVGRIVVGNTW
jgi:hypothetical protein